jgi:tetratricopeptide (TPR) repeat protein
MLRLASLDLKPDQRLDLARLALNAGEIAPAEAQVRIAMLSADSQMPALQILLDLAAQKRDWYEYQKISSRIEAVYRKSGNTEEAARYALDKWGRLSAGWERKQIEEEILRILKEYPHYAPAYVEAAGFYEKQSPRTALQYLKKSASISPGNFHYSNRLAEAYLRRSMIAEAEAIYRGFLNDPDVASDAYVGLAHCKEAGGKKTEAIAILLDGINRISKPDSLWWDLGRIQAEAGNLTEAASSYLQYAALTPNKPDGLLRAAEIYERLGNQEAARSLYLRVLSIDPQNDHARRALQ